jgi:hypothetical protein
VLHEGLGHRVRVHRHASAAAPHAPRVSSSGEDREKEERSGGVAV